MANWLNEAGHDALHTFDLPKKNLTPDIDLVSRAVRDGDVGCNKRSALHRLFGCYTYGAMPVGYCALHGLEKVLRANLAGIEAAFTSSRFIEITRDSLVVHE